jgi:dephospho-CoA kinase
MRRVGLTGGIATGKSTVRRRLASHGVPTIDADALAHAVLAPGTPGAAAVTSRFGPEVVRPDGSINREALGRIVFADAAARADLEAIVHPAVYGAIVDWFAALPADTTVAVADIPLLFETGRAGDFDVVVVTTCEPEEQLRRLVHRDGLTIEAARQRVAAQWPLAEKVRRADHVIDTGRPQAETDAAVDALLARVSGSVQE